MLDFISHHVFMQTVHLNFVHLFQTCTNVPLLSLAIISFLLCLIVFVITSICEFSPCHYSCVHGLYQCGSCVLRYDLISIMSSLLHTNCPLDIIHVFMVCISVALASLDMVSFLFCLILFVITSAYMRIVIKTNYFIQVKTPFSVVEFSNTVTF